MVHKALQYRHTEEKIDCWNRTVYHLDQNKPRGPVLEIVSPLDPGGPVSVAFRIPLEARNLINGSKHGDILMTIISV